MTIPVILVTLPSQNYFLGTFDTISLQTWWKSEPLPAEVAEITKGMQIYAEIQLATARLKDGTWAVFQSKNYGRSWWIVWNKPEEIYDIVKINYGWALLNAAGGFYETVDAGSNWTKISSLPAGQRCAIANIGNGDMLICTDGRYIWKSTDIAHTWRKVCDQNTIWHGPLPTWKSIVYYSGPTFPCVAGACGMVLVSHGPFVTVSTNNGDSWRSLQFWDYWSYEYPGLEALIDLRLDRTLKTGQAEFIIKQILIASIDGPMPFDCTYMIRYDELKPLPGETLLFSRVFKSQNYSRYVSEDWKFSWKYLFCQYLSPSDNSQQLNAYDMPITGTTYNDRVVISAQMADDGNGNQVPHIRISRDGGVTWVDIDVTKARIGELPTQMIGGPFLDDSFIKNTWMTSSCGNEGWWVTTEGYVRRNLTYDMNFGLLRPIYKNYQMNAAVSKRQIKAQDFDTIISKGKTSTYQADAFAQGRPISIYRIGSRFIAFPLVPQEFDAIISEHKTSTYQTDQLAEKRIYKSNRMNVLVLSQLENAYQMGAFLVKTDINQRLSDIERIIPQFWDVYFPDLPYSPYDSREEEI
jgi:hypothetical protein